MGSPKSIKLTELSLMKLFRCVLLISTYTEPFITIKHPYILEVYVLLLIPVFLQILQYFMMLQKHQMIRH